MGYWFVDASNATLEESSCRINLAPLDMVPTTLLRPDGKLAPGALRLDLLEWMECAGCSEDIPRPICADTQAK